MTAALAQHLSEVLTPPPSLDWASILIDDDLKRLEKHVDKFDTEARIWRTQIISNFRNSLDIFKLEAASKTQENVLASFSQPIEAIEKAIETFATPLHSIPEFADAIARLSTLSQRAGKFVRKLMRRIEQIRVAQHSTCIDMYYGLLAFRSEFEDTLEAHKTFSDSKALGTFLRQKIA